MAADLNKLKVEYDGQCGLAGQFLMEVVRQIEALIGQENISLGFPIQSRVKSWNSIEEKVERTGIKLKSLASLQDLIGLRITLIFLRDVEKVKSVIEKSFDVKKAYNTSDRLTSSEFGYSSIHILVKCPKSWKTVPTLAHLVDFQVEVQVRTLAQHIWAEVSHKLQYKSEESVPHEVLRSISRSSALLETVDLEFERVLQSRDEYKTELKVADAFNDMLLNSDNLAVLLEDLLPIKNKGERENYSSLIDDCKQLEVFKVSDLREIIKVHESAILKDDAQKVIEYQSVLDEEGVSETEINLRRRLMQNTFFTHVGLARMALSKEFGDDKMTEILLKSIKI